MDYLTLGLGAAGAVVMFSAQKAWQAWKNRPKQLLDPTLDKTVFETVFETVFLDSMAAIQAEVRTVAGGIDTLGRTIAATPNPVVHNLKLVQESIDALAGQRAEEEITDIEPVVKILSAINEQSRMQLQALDALVLEFSKFAKHQTGMFNMLFNGGSISTMDEEASARQEKIQTLMRRYQISLEVATARVDGTSVYAPNTGRTGMRENS